MMKRKSNNTDEGHAFYIAIIASIITLLIAPLIGAAVGGKIASYFDFLRDFQTLIGGILAIFAAFLTVAEMRKAEKQSAARHDDLMKLSLRPELRILERALHPQLDHLKKARDDYQSVADGFAEIPSEGQAPYFFRYAGNFLNALAEIDSILDRPQFCAAEAYFGGPLILRLFNLRRDLSEIRRHMEACSTHSIEGTALNVMWLQLSLRWTGEELDWIIHELNKIDHSIEYESGAGNH